MTDKKILSFPCEKKNARNVEDKFLFIKKNNHVYCFVRSGKIIINIHFIKDPQP